MKLIDESKLFIEFLFEYNNDMNIFDILPQEILQDIISRIDCQSIPLMYELSSKFSQLNFDNGRRGPNRLCEDPNAGNEIPGAYE